ncbi:MFS transporter [Nocardia sp.]|uniref:MFS transporter n=1 Tax=Nocardia sp. TaxID=1821 RepID=UPI0026042EB6|nr:MFS transporter [Nocardia sp.]
MTVRESDRTGDPGAAARSPGAWIALSACLIAVFMQMLDLTIVHTAMPALARDLGASSSAELLIVSAYGLVFACMLPTAARIGDLFGRHIVFPAALAAFGAASVWCGIASGPAELVLARGVAGIAAAMASAQTIAIITGAFPERARATAFGLYGAVAGLAGMAGPMLGGALVDADPLGLGWRAVFLINVPLAGVAVALANRHPQAARGVIDPGGLVRRLDGDRRRRGFPAPVARIITARVRGYAARHIDSYAPVRCQRLGGIGYRRGCGGTWLGSRHEFACGRHRSELLAGSGSR